MYSINLENYSDTDIRQLFTTIYVKYNPNTSIDFFDCNYTLNDIEQCRQHVQYELNQMPGSNVRQTTIFIQKAQSYLVNNLMKKTSVLHNNTNNNNNGKILDELKTINETFVNIDTQYLDYVHGDYIIPQDEKSNFTVRLTQNINHVKEMQLNSLQVPFTFYNITTEKTNNYFVYTNNSSLTSTTITLDDGLYTIEDMITEINNNITVDIIFSYSAVTNKVTITNNETDDYTFSFFDSETKTEPLTTLGWMLGFKVLSYDSSSDIYSIDVTVNASSSTTATYSQQVYCTKYVVLCVDDFNNVQNSSGIVQIDKSKQFIRPKSLPYDSSSGNGNCLTCDNINSIDVTLDEVTTNNMTKKQKYSQAQILNYNTKNIQKQVDKSNINGNNILSIVPIDFNSLIVNQMISFDVSTVKSNRVYANPIMIDRLKVRILDDQGYELKLNGNDWGFSLKLIS